MGSVHTSKITHSSGLVSREITVRGRYADIVERIQVAMAAARDTGSEYGCGFITVYDLDDNIIFLNALSIDYVKAAS